MMKNKTILFDDLKNIFRKSIVILADYENIYPTPDENEKGFVYPHIDLFYPEYANKYGTIVIIKDKIENIDDLCLTLLHELIHLYLYSKDIYCHDEEYIENEAKRIYEINKKSVKKLIRGMVENVIDR